MKSFAMLVSTLLSMCVAQIAVAAGDVTLTMNDLPNQPVNGLVHPSGVQFGFTVGGLPNLDARYASGGPGSITFVQDPSIEGTTAGILSIIFPNLTPIVGFGVARNNLSAIPVGAAVQLFDAANAPLGAPVNLPMNPMPTFAEAQFNYSGAAVKRMTINFTTSTAGQRFAFDNLRFRLVPEPASIVVAMTAFVVILRSRIRRNVAAT